MKSAGLRLILAAILFAGWIGWLVYLSATTTKPIVLSRPQFLVSSLDVVAAVEGTDDKPSTVTVVEVHWPPREQAQQLVGKTIKVTNLLECREDWSGPGEYILPLIEIGHDEYQVAHQPPSPGFAYGRPRIYRSTDRTRRQLQEIRKPEILQVPEF